MIAEHCGFYIYLLFTIQNYFMKKFSFLVLFIALHFSLQCFSQYSINTEIKDFNKYPGSEPKGMKAFGNEIILALKSPDVGVEPFRYNVVNKSYELIKNIDNNFWDSRERKHFFEMSGKFYFFASPSSNVQLWETDLQSNVTTKVKDFGTSLNSNTDVLTAKVVNNKLFIKLKNKIYSSDGTAAGTIELATLFNTPTTFADLNGEIYFYKSTYDTGTELWKSDGTVAGTKIVKDLNPGKGSSVYIYDEYLYTVNNKIIFLATNLGNNSNGIYSSDGTAEGTVFVKSTPAGFRKNIISEETDKIVFTNNTTLWISDGTPNGTHSLNYTVTGMKDYVQYKNKIFINADSGTYVVAENETVTKLNGPDNSTLHVVAKSDRGNYLILKELTEDDSKLHFYDGVQVKKTDVYYSGEANFIEAEDRLIFNGYTEFYKVGYDVGRNTELFYYMADGTSGLEKEFFTHSSSYPRIFERHQDKVYFIGTVGILDQIFTIDNNNVVKQISNFTNVQVPNNWTGYQPVITSGDYIYYRAGSILRSNGTASGTEQITLPVNERVTELYPLSDTSILVKSFNTQQGFMKIWKLNTNSSSPELLTEMPSNNSNDQYGEFKKAGNFVYFKMENISKNELWKSDGTNEGTVKLRDLPSYYWTKILLEILDQKLFLIETVSSAEVNDKLVYVDLISDQSHFVAEESSYDTESSFVADNQLFLMSSFYNPYGNYHLNKVNSNFTGTTLVATLPAQVYKKTKCGNYMYLEMGDNNTRAGLFRTDGTTAGTLAISPDLTYRETMGCLQNQFYFKSNNDYYFTNGMPGDRKAVEFKTGGQPFPLNYFYHFETINNRVFISFQDGTKGYELFVSEVFTAPLAAQETRVKIKDNNIVIYPNPTTNEINIKIPNGEKIVNVEFVDPVGRTVATSNQEVINIEKLSAGIYFIKVKTKAKVYSGKVIKK